MYICMCVGRICANSADFAVSLELQRGEPQTTTHFMGINLVEGFLPVSHATYEEPVAQEKPLV